MLRLLDLRCEYRTEPLGIDEPSPRFSWALQTEERGRSQVSYRLKVASDPALLTGQPDLWDSGTVRSESSSQIEYQGESLAARKRYFWRVEVEDDVAEILPSEITWFETGMMGEDWGADWITLKRPQDVSDESRPCPYLRRRFELSEAFEQARVYVTALGLYRIFLNGSRIGDHHLAPGWTDYRKRIPYQTMDITDHLRTGDNVVGIVLADGWYCGYLGTARERELYGRVPQALVRVVLDGKTVLVSDRSWEGSFGPHLASDIYLGEIYDGTKALNGWTDAAHEAGGWQPVEVSEGAPGKLVTSPIEPVRSDAELEPKEVTRLGDDSTLFDFGQNLAGWTRLAINDSKAGSPLVVRHAEILDEDGELYVKSLRHASATDTYATSSGEEVLEPWFTYHGFRYAQVHHPGISADAIKATSVSARTPVRITGDFECSSEDLNKLHQAVQWSYRSNWLEVPTDCPNRDERLGWTGDATICANTACYLMDAAPFYSKWMIDVEDAKTEQGHFTDVAPAVAPWTVRGAPGWGDGGVVVPWMLHRFYGDTRVLAKHLPSMKRWVDAIWADNLDLLWTREVGSNYGDWLEVDSYTIKEVIATCMFARSARMVADSCAAVDDHESAKIYSDLFDAIGKEFRRAYIKYGRIAGDTQSSYVLAIACGVLDPSNETSAVTRLVELISENGGKMTTGFLATEHLLPVLADHGHIDVAYALLEAPHFPSWLHFINNGATTMWEHWDSWTPEGGFKNPFMNSFNHCSLGSVARFLYEYVGGVRPMESGFKRFQVSPRPGGSLHSASVRYRSIAGPIESSWQLDQAGFHLEVVVPANTRAEVTLPKGEITESGRAVEKIEGLLSLDLSGQQALVSIGGGAYSFNVAF